jgi:hypothetical protein
MGAGSAPSLLTLCGAGYAHPVKKFLKLALNSNIDVRRALIGCRMDWLNLASNDRIERPRRESTCRA